MNVIKVEFNIDIDNEQQLTSFNAFVKALKSSEGQSPVASVPVKDIRPNPAAANTTQQATPAAAASTKPQPGANPGEHTDVKLIDSIRKLIGLKVGAHRIAIKAKLSEFGCETATGLPVDRYVEFHSYLESLA